MAELLRRLWRWLRHTFTGRYQVVFVPEQPEKLLSSTLYLIEDDGFLEHASMRCPCGCGHIIYLNLLVDESPCWSVLVHDDGAVSLNPSIWRRDGCRSHFFFKRSKVLWCPAQ